MNFYGGSVEGIANFGTRYILIVPVKGMKFTMNSTNWPVPNLWVFIAQLVEHCSANAEGTSSNPVEAPKTVSYTHLTLPTKLEV